MPPLPPLPPLPPSPPSGAPLLSLAMMVKNEEAFLEDALRSAAPYVDEMVVVDTGSTDRTVEIARDLGARVEFFAWCDDFSAARNYSLRACRGATCWCSTPTSGCAGRRIRGRCAGICDRARPTRSKAGR